VPRGLPTSRLDYNSQVSSRSSSSAASSPPALAYAAWIAICLIWGTTYLGIRVCLETMPPGLMGGLRWLAAGVVLTGIQIAGGHRLPPRSAWPRLALIGLLFIVGGNGLVVWAEQWVPSGLTAVLLATSPFWMVGIEVLLPNGERPHWWTWIGLAVGFAGIVLLVWPDLTQGGAGGAQFLGGVVGLQLACLTWSIGSSYERRRGGEGEHTLGGAAVEMLCGGLVLTLLGTATGEWRRLAFSARSLSAFAYLVLVGSVVGYSAYIYTLKHLRVSTISLYSYVNPIIAVILGVLLLGERFGTRSLVASAVVLAGVAIVRTTPETAKRPEEQRN
jgi:drug/metabolite transporter (DMT)-like permease